MRSKGFDGMVCSIAGALETIGDRWGVLILRDLLLGLSRYDDFRRSTGVTNATLTDRLRHLEASGLVERRRYRTNPERHGYFLTPKGREIAPVMAMLAQLGDRWNVSGASAPPMVFVNRKTGAPLDWTPIDRETGETLSAKDMAAKEGPGADDLVRWRMACAAGRRHDGDPSALSDAEPTG